MLVCHIECRPSKTTGFEDSCSLCNYITLRPHCAVQCDSVALRILCPVPAHLPYSVLTLWYQNVPFFNIIQPFTQIPL